MPQHNAEQWTRFWQQGFITTFGAAKTANYDGVLRAFWLDVFSSLPDDARVLDIATGNGAVATLTVEAGERYGKHFFVVGSDIAEINTRLNAPPEVRRLRDRVEFHGRTPAERQPFGDASFDLVCSQFGFEYSNVEATLAEVFRVLKPGGRFVAVTHHSGSTLIEESRRELAVYATAIQELDLFGLLERYFRSVGELGGTDEAFRKSLQAARPLSRRINDVMNGFRERFPSDACASEIVNAVSGLVRGARGTERAQLLVKLRDTASEFELAQARLADMVRAALDSAQSKALQSRALKTPGYGAAERGEFLDDDGAVAGWRFVLRKP